MEHFVALIDHLYVVWQTKNYWGGLDVSEDP